MTEANGIFDNLPHSVNEFLNDCEALELEINDALVLSLDNNQPALTEQIQARINQVASRIPVIADDMNVITEQLCWETLTELGTVAKLEAQDKHGTELQYSFNLLYLPVSYQGTYSNLDLTSLLTDLATLPHKLGVLNNIQSLMISPFALPLATATDTELRIRLFETLIKQHLGRNPDMSVLLSGQDFAEHPDLEMTLRTAYFPALLIQPTPLSDSQDVDSIAEMETNSELYDGLKAVLSKADNINLITSPTIIPVAVESALAFQGQELGRLYKELAGKQKETSNMDVVYNSDGITLTLTQNGNYIEASNIEVPTIAIAETVMGAIRNAAEGA
ncbi:hypothetical protein DI392_04295 [Vibrio albus]|uniref:Uncharacterized protein n=1 Tax=Vibrio albus TaxID=2200953 RepID=A0A2U3BC29_9VIBR|nr:hypothetical protein [Vibrio albus]PWI34338.1 hypothetical protein DI392_04295 [Vibrio albus]